MSWFGSYPAPDHTPAGNPIGPVEGDEVDVSERATQLTQLAEMMTNAAATIQRLVDHGSTMEGAAIDRLRESAGQVGDDLGLAADLYQIVAPHVTAYASALSAARTAVDPRADNLVDLWDQYALRARESDDLAGGVGRRPDADAEPEDVTAFERRQDEAQQAGADADAALAAWEDEAARYDTAWNTWHDAFLAAANGITEEATDAIRDTPEDDWRGFLASASEFLMWAGIVLAVLAVVIGGPIIAVLGTVVAVLALIVTICQMPYGDADGWDLAFAIVGVIPFGAIAEGATALRGGSGTLLSQLGDGGGSFVRTMFDVTPASGNSSLIGDIGRAFSDDGTRWLMGLRSGQDFFSTMNTLGPELVSGGDFMARLFTGRDAAFLDVVDTLYADAPDMLAYLVGAGGTGLQSMLTFSEPWRP